MTLTELARAAYRGYAVSAGIHENNIAFELLSPVAKKCWEESARAIWGFLLEEDLDDEIPIKGSASSTIEDLAKWAYEFWESKQQYLSLVGWPALSEDEKRVWRSIVTHLSQSYTEEGLGPMPTPEQIDQALDVLKIYLKRRL